MVNIPENERHLCTPNAIRTFTGKYVDVFNPKAENICIEDIAHSLSMQPRFGGHLPNFYSVAEHSVNCAEMSINMGNDNVRAQSISLGALLHDASEAYLIDVPSPIKANLSEYKAIEDKLMQVIAQKFGFQYPLYRSVKFIDESMLNMEWNNMMITQKTVFKCWQPREAEMHFLSMYRRLSHSNAQNNPQ